MKILTCILLALLLTGCGALKPRTLTKTEYQDVFVPIPYCPRPPSIERPEYYVNSLTEEQKRDDGEVTKAHVISSKEAITYANNLELIYNTYRDFSESTLGRIQQLKNLGYTVDDSLMKESTNSMETRLNSLSVQIERNNENSSEEILQTLEKME